WLARTALQPIVSRATARTPPPTAARVAMSILGNIVVIVRISDSRISAPTTRLANALSQGGLAHGPSTSRSLHSISRNAVVSGSRMPHNAWTASVITPSGAPGINTTALAERISRLKTV